MKMKSIAHCATRISKNVGRLEHLHGTFLVFKRGIRAIDEGGVSKGSTRPNIYVTFLVFRSGP